MKRKFSVLGLSVLLLLISCGKSEQAGAGFEKTTIVATTFSLYDFSKNVGQDKVEVSMIFPQETDTQSYKPTPEDIQKINKSSIFVYTDKNAEPWAYEIAKNLKNKKVKVVEASAGIDSFMKEHKKQHSLHKNSHIWLDFFVDQKIVSDIAKALVEVDYAHRVFYLVNAKKYKQKLFLLDEKYKTSLAKCRRDKIFYTGDFTFDNLLERYGLTYIPVNSDDIKENQVSVKMDEIFGTTNENNTHYLYHDNVIFNFPDVIEENNIELLALYEGNHLDNEEVLKKSSFMDIMHKNLKNLKIGLGCQ